MGRHDELVARHFLHGAQHRRIHDAAPAQVEHEFQLFDVMVGRCGHGQAAPLDNVSTATGKRPWERGRLARFFQDAGGTPALRVLCPPYPKISASRVKKGSSVMLSRSGVTEMRLSASAERSLPSRSVCAGARS